MIPHSAGFLLVWTPLPSPTMGLFGFFISGMFWLGPSSLSLDSVIYSHGTNYHLYTHHFPSLPSAQVSISPELCVCLPHYLLGISTSLFQGHSKLNISRTELPSQPTPSATKVVLHLFPSAWLHRLFVC